MIKNIKKYKITMRVFSVFSCLFVFAGYANPINIRVNGGAFVNCEYSSMNFNDGQTPELNIVANTAGQTCTIMGGGGGVTTNPAPIYPIGLLEENGVPVKKPSYLSWNQVDGATYYQVRVYAGTAAENSGVKIYERNLSLQGSAVQIASYNNFCGGTDTCSIDGPISYYNYNTGTQLGVDLVDGNYHWQVRVVGGDTPTSFSNATADFIINAEVATAATETPLVFADAWVNQNYNPTTGVNNFATKAQLRNMLDNAPYNGYQEIAGNKKVYIVNNSISSETVIPSCVNGKIKTPEGQSGSTCSVDIPFELNDIFALRLKTRTIGQSGVLNKASNQLYPYEGAIYNITLSKYPGRMVANQADDFQGNCSATSINLIGEFSLYTAQSGNANTFCIVPDDTQLYANVELDSSQTQCVAGPGPSGHVCQLDINLNGFATSNN